MKYIVYDIITRRIQRGGTCSPDSFKNEAHEGEFAMEGTANDVTQKIEFDGLDDKGQPINPRIVDKTPQEIEADNPIPPEVSFEKQSAQITNKQWQDVLNRLGELE